MDLHRTYTARKRRCLCLVLLAAGLLAGCNETGQPEETETTVQEIVLAEETQPMTAPDERVLALTPYRPNTQIRFLIISGSACLIRLLQSCSSG